MRRRKSRIISDPVDSKKSGNSGRGFCVEKPRPIISQDPYGQGVWAQSSLESKQKDTIPAYFFFAVVFFVVFLAFGFFTPHCFTPHAIVLHLPRYESCYGPGAPPDLGSFLGGLFIAFNLLFVKNFLPGINAKFLKVLIRYFVVFELAHAVQMDQGAFQEWNALSLGK